MQIKICWYHIIFLSFFLATFTALKSQPPFQNPVTLNQKNGLPSNLVLDVVQDQQGFIWIATTNGLCRYDGSEIKIYDYVNNDTSALYTRSVRDLMVDRLTGKIWLSTSLGAHVYNPVLDTFQSYLPVVGDTTQLANTTVSYTYQDRQGQIWLSSFTDGLAKYQRESDNFSQFFPSRIIGASDEVQTALFNQVNALIQDYRQDHIYWLMTKAGLVRWDQKLGTMELIPLPDDGSISFEKLVGAKVLFQHSDGTIIIGLWANGFMTFHPETKQWTATPKVTDTDGEVIDIRTIMTILPKDQSCVYITNNWNQLFVYDVNQGKITRTWKGSRKQKEQYTLHLVDKEGNLWAGYKRGLSIYSPLAQDMALYPLSELDEDLDFEYRPEGVIYDPESHSILAGFSYARGLYTLDLQTGRFNPVVSPQDQSMFKYVHGILQTGDKKVWILTAYDIYEYDLQKKRATKIRPREAWEGASFIAFDQDSRHDVWVGTYEHGVFRYDFQHKTWHHYKEEIETPTEDRHSIWLWGFTEDREGNVWFRCGTGYSIYKPGEDRFLNYPFKKELKNNYQGINTFGLDGDGLLWVSGGSEGLGQIDPRFPEKGIFYQFGSKEGYTMNGPHQIVRDVNNDMWLVDYQRLARYKSEERHFEYFDQYYGIPAYDEELDMEPLNGCDLSTLSDGRIALQYRRGLALFHPDSLKRNSILPTPYLSSFEVNNKPYSLDSAITVKKSINLRAMENDFAFEFSALNFTVPHQVRFKYRLVGEGVEEPWVDAGSRRYAAFTNVPGGNYKLQLLAANSEGTWNEKPFELSLFVGTPWYQTAIFRILLLGGIAGIIFTIYKLRVNQIKHQQDQKAEFERKLANVEMNALRAQMNPHFIFNCLNSIDSFIIRNETHKASEYLNDFARLIRLILQNSRTNLINLKDELEALGLYLQMEQLRFRHKFKYEINVHPEVNTPATVIPPMLIQPYVENAVWHGLLHRRDEGNGKVIIDIREENECLIITVTDNGIGREKSAEIKAKKRMPSRKSMGIQITGDRIAMINHLYDTTASADTIDLKDEEGKPLGTKVIIKIPI